VARLTGEDLLKAVQERFYVSGRDVLWKVPHGKWLTEPSGMLAGHKGKRGYLTINFTADGTHQYIPAHRVAVMLRDAVPLPSALVVDHLNGDPSDNSFENLRAVSTMLNSARRHGTSRGMKLLGASRKGFRWRADVQFKGNRYQLGWFDTAVEAVLAYWGFQNSVDPEGTSQRQEFIFQQVKHAARVDETVPAKPRSDTWVGVVGVNKIHGRYHTYKQIKGVRRWLGSFKTLEEATAARAAGIPKHERRQDDEKAVPPKDFLRGDRSGSTTSNSLHRG
jgi:hypothetical protein